MASVRIAGTNAFHLGVNAEIARLAQMPSTTVLVNTSAGKLSMAGRVTWADGATHNIAKVHYRTHSSGNVGTGGSTVRLSLQDVTTAGTIQMAPDGTVDQSATFAVPANNTWVTATLGSVRSSVAENTLLAVVIDWGSYAGSDSFNIAQAGNSAVISAAFRLLVSTDSGATWSASGISPYTSAIVIFESDDSTPVFGTFQACTPYKTLNSHSISSASNPKEYGNKISLPFDCVIKSVLIASGTIPNNSDFDIKHYNSGGTLQSTFAVDATLIGPQAFLEYPITPITYTKNTNFYLTVTPTTTNNITFRSYEVNAAEHLSVWPGGANFTYITRDTGTGTITENTARRFSLGIGIGEITDSAGAGGGLLVHPGMTGGCNG